MSSIMEVVLPGRMDELELFGVEVDTHSNFKVVIFTFMFEKDARELIEVNFDIDNLVWWVYIDKACFDGIPETLNAIVSENDALRKLQYVLVDFRPKTAKGLLALKRWRNKLQVWPAKLLTLNK